MAPAKKPRYTAEQEEALSAEIGGFFYDPLGFVLYAYPWGKPGPLEGFDGPLQWQRDFLTEWGEEIKKRDFDGFTAVDPLLFSTVSGHGIGKSALCAMIVDFIMSTRPFCKGVVTANTAPQLETKTWAEIAKWSKWLINAHWFRVTTGRGAMKMVHVDHDEAWRVDGMAWREHKADAFAGQHSATSTSFYLFDEASSIPNAIFDTARGGLTDGEPMQFLFGNGTKNSGYFFDTHHRYKHRYICRNIDSRTVEITNKGYLQDIIDDYGEDSDTAKIRVRGMFPSKSMNQVVSTELVRAARKRRVEPTPYDAVTMGVDIARYGDDKSIIRVRKGRDAKSVPPMRFEKLDTMEMAVEVVKAANIHSPEYIFVDGGGVGGGVVDRLRELGLPNVFEVDFGENAFNKTDYRNRGTECWMAMAEWFKGDVAVSDDDDFEEELTGREYGYIGETKKFIEPKKEMKKRGLKSPDDADALALTFAIPTPAVTAQQILDRIRGGVQGQGVNYDPLGYLENENQGDGVNYNPMAGF
jgi:hypothetical protein